MSYDAANEILTIRFVSGLVYNYKNVSSEEYLKMKKASSKGKYLNQHIKGKYEFEQVSPDVGR
jgi:KTSC domain